MKMDWLNDGRSEINFGSSFYRPAYKTFDSILPRFKPRSNLFDPAIGLFDLDEIDDLETDNLLSNRFKPSLFSNPPYFPSYYQKRPLIDTYESLENQNSFLNNLKENQIPTQFPKTDYFPKPFSSQFLNDSISKNKKSALEDRIFNQPLDSLKYTKQGINYGSQSYEPFNTSRSSNYNVNNNFQRTIAPKPFLSTPPKINNIEPHNNFQQRFLQYQHRIQQQDQQQQPTPPQFQQKQQSPPQFQQKQQQLRHQYSQDQQQNNQNYENLKYKQLSERHPPKNGNFQNNFNNNSRQPALFPTEPQLQSKQFSETSIPSTNADPLNSNSPTPPILPKFNNQINQNFTINKKKKYLVTKKLPLNQSNEEEG